VAATSIKNIAKMLSQGGGIASSNIFKVTFLPNGRSVNNRVFNNIKEILPGFNEAELAGDVVGASAASYISMMCDDAVLPGVQAASGQINGLYTGSGTYNYAHTRLYNDLTLSWICDANMTPVKFLTTWFDAIFNEYSPDDKIRYSPKNQKDSGDVKKRERNRSTRLSYPDDYTLDLTILKAEKDSRSETGRPAIRYYFDGIYPYSIDSIPLSFGASTLVKVTANFYYEKWYTYHVDQWSRQSSTYNA
jgi:hypothetical protein